MIVWFKSSYCHMIKGGLDFCMWTNLSAHIHAHTSLLRMYWLIYGSFSIAVKEAKRERKEAKLIKQLEKQKQQEAADREKLEEQQNKNGKTIVLPHAGDLIHWRPWEETDVMVSMLSQVGRTPSVWPCLGPSWITLSPLSCGPTWQDRLLVLASCLVSTRLSCLTSKENKSSRWRPSTHW